MRLSKKFSIEMKSAVVYTFSSVFTRGLAIITVPIFTRIMSSEQIGIVNVYNSWYSILSVIATLALTSGGFTIAMKDFEKERDEYQSSVLSLTSIIAILLFILYFLFPNFFNNLLGLPPCLIYLMLFGLLFTPARDFWLARQRYEYKYKLPAIITTLAAILSSLLSIFAVLIANSMNIKNIGSVRLYANYIIMYGVAFIFWIYLLSKGKSFFSKRYWKYSLAISIPLMGYNVAAEIMNVSDRLMIGKIVGNSAVGIYGTLYTVSSLSLMVWQAINSSFIPYLFRNIENKSSKIKEISLELLSIYSLVAILLTMLAPEIIRILAPIEYYEAIYIMPPIAAGVFFTSLAQLYSNICVYYKKTKFVMYPAALSAIINIILNLIFIPQYGYMAAAYTTLFSYVLWGYIQIYLANKTSKEYGKLQHKIYSDNKIIKLSILTTVVSLSGLYLYENTILRYSFIIVLIIAVIIMLKNYLKNKNESI